MISDRLSDAMGELESSPPQLRSAFAEELGGRACAGAEGRGDALPVSIRLPRIVPEPGETWAAYRFRAEEQVAVLRQRLEITLAARCVALPAANAIKACADPNEIRALDALDDVELVELDDPLFAAAGGGVPLGTPEIGLESFARHHPGCGGSGVRVAVLDSGVDLDHPALHVAESVSVCRESDRVPGLHGTHCAGTIASRDAVHRGVAPGVELLNVKVLDAHGRGQHTNVVRGIEAAIELGADVLSLSLGFNHLPAERRNGHAWLCVDGDCVLCRAVETAVLLGHVVVAAAGNEHVRGDGEGPFGRAERSVTCPANAPLAIAVGTEPPDGARPRAGRRGAGRAGEGTKPDLVAPGVNVWSTAPVARLGPEAAATASRRSELFVRSSGTSVATSIVAGAVALLIEERRSLCGHAEPDAIRRDLLSHGVMPVEGGAAASSGAGRLDLAAF